jgi:hypothetical protein
MKDIGGSRTLVSNWWLVNSFLGPKNWWLQKSELVAQEFSSVEDVVVTTHKVHTFKSNENLMILLVVKNNVQRKRQVPLCRRTEVLSTGGTKELTLN